MLKKVYTLLIASVLSSATSYAAGGVTIAYDGTDEATRALKRVDFAFRDGIRTLGEFPLTINPGLKHGEFGSVERAYDRAVTTAKAKLDAALVAAPTLVPDKKASIKTAFDGFVARLKAVQSYLFAASNDIDEALKNLPDDRPVHGVAIVDGFSGLESAVYGGGEDGKAAFLTLLNQKVVIEYEAARVKTFSPYLNPSMYAVFAFASGGNTITHDGRPVTFSPTWNDLLQSYARGEANTATGYACELAVIQTLADEAARKGTTLGKTIHRGPVYSSIIDPADLNHSLPYYERAATVITQDEIIAEAARRAGVAPAGGGAAAGGGGAAAAAAVVNTAEMPS